MRDTPSLSRLLSQQAQLDDVNQRLDLLEDALLLLANQAGSEWSRELLLLLEQIRRMRLG